MYSLIYIAGLNHHYDIIDVQMLLFQSICHASFSYSMS